MNGCCVTYFMESAPHHIPWGFVDVDLVIDTTHMFRTREELQGHIMAGAKRVVLAALPMDDPTIPTLAVGCNDDTYAGQVCKGRRASVCVCERAREREIFFFMSSHLLHGHMTYFYRT